MFLATISEPVRSSWFNAFNYLQLTVLCANLVFGGLAMRVMMASVPLHRHLLILLINLIIIEFMVSVIRCAIIFVWFSEPYSIWHSTPSHEESVYYLTAAEFVCIVALICQIPHVVAERGFATLMFSDYEKRNNTRIVLFGCLLQYLCGVVAVITLHQGLLQFLTCAIIGLCLIFTSTACYYIFNAINQKRYRKSISVGTTYTLSQRFQLSENIRTSSLLRYVCFVSAFVCIVLCVTFYCITSTSANPLLMQIMYCISNFTASLYGLFLSIVSLSTHKKFVSSLGRFFAFMAPNKRREKSNNDNLHLHGVEGARIAFEHEREVDKHFVVLNKAWA
ncbi:hypothetical protein Q1695_008550 [Nippostrongylus brasiliensis]|nr:hypothetical protein Q1695_008550 [Nippostrongylus brasiliensis]